MPVVLQLSQSQAACLEFLSACKQAMIQAGQRWEFSFVMATYRCEQNWGTKLKITVQFLDRILRFLFSLIYYDSVFKRGQHMTLRVL